MCDRETHDGLGVTKKLRMLAFHRFIHSLGRGALTPTGRYEVFLDLLLRLEIIGDIFEAIANKGYDGLRAQLTRLLGDSL